jgi:hypothetical protein
MTGERLALFDRIGPQLGGKPSPVFLTECAVSAAAIPEYPPERQQKPPPPDPARRPYSDRSRFATSVTRHAHSRFSVHRHSPGDLLGVHDAELLEKSQLVVVGVVSDDLPPFGP